MQDGLPGRSVPIQETTFRVGKVIRVHPASHSVDIAPMDGPIISDVAVLETAYGSIFGISTLTSPSYDKEAPAQMTYPEAEGAVQDPDTVHGDAHRDIYVVFTQLGGSVLGLGRHVCIGAIRGRVTEMSFVDKLYEDQWLVRHPSDVQVTIDKDGKTSVQHPSGARVTIGDNRHAVDLEGKDQDKQYKLRENKDKKVGIRVRSSAGDVIDVDPVGDITVYARRDVHVRANRDVNARVKRNLNAKVDKQASVQCDTASVYANSNMMVASKENMTVAAGATMNDSGTLAINMAKKLTLLGTVEADVIRTNNAQIYVLTYGTLVTGATAVVTNKAGIKPIDPPEIDLNAIDGVA
jgi:hypothetical protein